MKRWAILAAVVAALAAAVWFTAQRNERRASEAERAAQAAEHRATTAEVKGAVIEAVGRETVRTAARLRTIERAASGPLKEISDHAGSSAPVDPDLARRWVAGLDRLCDAAGSGGCDRPDAAAGGAGK